MNSMQRAQRAYDNQLPPDEDNCEAECPDCEDLPLSEDGERPPCERCGNSGVVERHHWRRLPGSAPDGTSFVVCRTCGKVEEA